MPIVVIARKSSLTLKLGSPNMTPMSVVIKMAQIEASIKGSEYFTLSIAKEYAPIAQNAA